MKDKAETVIQAIDKTHTAYTNDLDFENLSLMFEPLLNAYSTITSASKVSISIFDYYYEQKLPILSLFSTDNDTKEIFEYFNKIEKNELLTPFKSFIIRL